MLGGLVCTVIWWATAIKRYLKIPHAWSVAILLTVVCVLLLVPTLGLIAYAVEWMV